MTKDDAIFRVPNFRWGLRYRISSKHIPAVQSNETDDNSYEAHWLDLTKLYDNVIYICLFVIKYFWDIGCNI